MQFRTAALALIPGAAHIDLGRAIWGLLYFLVFSVCLNGALIAPFISPEREFRLGCMMGAAGIWSLAFGDALRVAGQVKRPIKAGGDSFKAASTRRFVKKDPEEGKK